MPESKDHATSVSLRRVEAPVNVPARPRLRLASHKHNFAIIPSKHRGDHSSDYHCVRCKWTFRVNRRQDYVLAIDRDGHALPARENARRGATFFYGPCPALAPIGADPIGDDMLAALVTQTWKRIRNLFGGVRHWADQGIRTPHLR